MFETHSLQNTARRGFSAHFAGSGGSIIKNQERNTFRCSRGASASHGAAPGRAARLERASCRRLPRRVPGFCRGGLCFLYIKHKEVEDRRKITETEKVHTERSEWL